MIKIKSFVVFCFIIFVSSIYSQFSTIYIPESSGLLSAAAVDQHTVCFSGSGGIWRTTNDALTLTKVFNASSVGEIKFFGQTGYAIEPGNSFNIQVLKTTDGGINWNICYTSDDSVYFSRLYLKSANEIFTTFAGAPYGRASRLYHSIDGGNIWQVVFEINIYAFQGVTCDNSGNTFVAGSSYWSTPNLLNWTSHTSPVIFPFTNTEFANNKLYVGGEVDYNNSFYPSVASSTNQGVSWQSYILPDSGTCWNLDFSANGTGYANGSIRYTNLDWLAKTTDQGASWQRIYLSQFVTLENVCAGSSFIYAVGSSGTGGTIIKYDPSLVGINANSTTPKKFELMQNYPNPFNPATTIKYSISVHTNVNISIFDISGKKVATLIDKEENAGSYTINFNAAQLSSGTYFYKISAGNYIETKKMILVK